MARAGLAGAGAGADGPWPGLAGSLAGAFAGVRPSALAARERARVMSRFTGRRISQVVVTGSILPDREQG